MNKLFDIQNRKVTLNPEVLIVPEFKKLWDRDTTDNKSIATNEISYIIFRHSTISSSPYYNVADNKKDHYIIKDLFGGTTKWKPDKEVKEAAKKYLELTETDNTRLLKSAKSASNKIAEYFDSVDLTATDAYGKPIYSVRDLVASLKEAGNLVKSIAKLQEEVAKEQLESQTTKGGQSIGYFE